MVPLAPSDFHVKKLQLTSIIELWPGRPARAKPGKEKRKKKERKKERTTERKKEREMERERERGQERGGTWTGTWVDVSEWSVQGLVLVGGNCGCSFETRWVAFGREATCG